MENITMEDKAKNGITKKDILNFLIKNASGYLATIDNGIPRVVFCAMLC